MNSGERLASTAACSLMMVPADLGGSVAVAAGTSDISVVIPYCNRERYIDEAVQSVLAQTLKPLEIIIVNDCSRESSRRYLDRYAEVCTIVDLPKNVGLAGSRNAGIRHARGRFIAFLDDDDIWLPTKLEVQRAYLDEHPECAGVQTAIWEFFSSKPDFLWWMFRSGPMTLAQALTDGYWIVIPTLLIRSNVIRALGGFDVCFRENEDRDFAIRCCAVGYHVEGITEPLARIRREDHPSLSKRHWRMFFGHLKICWKHRALYYRVYGLHGLSNFVLATLHIATREKRHLHLAVRLLVRVFKVKWRVKPGYYEPVTSDSPRDRLQIPQASADGAQLAGGNAL
jgi:glycosyltransferase involved in cell wall biosynthesis